jgi:hypothetical protein
METIQTPKTAPSPTAPTVTLTSDQECLQIRKAIWTLYEIDDRDDWQRDLNHAVLKMVHTKPNDSPLHNVRWYRQLRAAIDLLFRSFEVRPDLSFRHFAPRINAAGFLATDGPFVYADDWWCCYLGDAQFSSSLKKLTKAGLVEQLDLGPNPERPDETILGLRLRADRIVDLLHKVDPVKFENLKY